MCRCELCKRRFRHVTIISGLVVCMVCLSGLLRGVQVAVRDEPGDQVAVLNEARELLFKPRVVLVVPAVVPVNEKGPLPQHYDENSPTPAALPEVTPRRRSPGRPRKTAVDAVAV